MSAPLDFALRWTQAAGGLVEEAAPGVFDVVPGALPEGVERLERITAEPEVTREDPSADLIAPGSAVFDAMLREAKGAGRTARTFLVGLTTTLPADALRGLTFGNASVRAVAACPLEHRTYAFTFHVVFESDERSDDLVTVGVDASTGRLARRSLDLALRAAGTEERLEALPLAPAVDADVAYAIACEELGRRLASAVTARRAELEGLLSGERERTARYYDDLAREMEEERTEDRASVAAKVDATRRQRDRTLAELGEKYALRVSASLATLVLLVQPKIHVEMVVAPASGAVARLAVVWDPLLRAVEALDCPTCGRPGLDFSLVAERLATRVGCPACASGAQPSPGSAPRQAASRGPGRAVRSRGEDVRTGG